MENLINQITENYSDGDSQPKNYQQINTCCRCLEGGGDGGSLTYRTTDDANELTMVT